MSKEKGEAEEDYLVPLLMRNKPPTIEGQEDNELADVDLRPESVSCIADHVFGKSL